LPVRAGKGGTTGEIEEALITASAGAVCGGAFHGDTTAAVGSKPIELGGRLATAGLPGTATWPVTSTGDAAVMPIAVSRTAGPFAPTYARVTGSVSEKIRAEG
jgi:hypothetical protein